MRLLIIRHGDPDYARDNLTEKGKREAKLLSEMLAKDKIDYLRRYGGTARFGTRHRAVAARI